MLILGKIEYAPTTGTVNHNKMENKSSKFSFKIQNEIVLCNFDWCVNEMLFCYYITSSSRLYDGYNIFTNEKSADWHTLKWEY